MLVVDQWEELYTQVSDEETTARFADALVAATTRGRLSVVLTVRGDFWGDVIEHRQLSDRLEGVYRQH